MKRKNLLRNYESQEGRAVPRRKVQKFPSPLSPSGQQWQVKKARLKGVQGALCTFHVSLPVQRIKERWVGRAEVGRRKRKERKRRRGGEREREAADYRIGKRDTVVGRFGQGCWQGEPGL